MRLLRRFDRFLDWCAGASAVLIMGLMFLTVADVTGRYALNAPITGTMEVTYLSLVALAFLGIGYVQKLRRHVAVDIVTSRVSARPRLILDLLGLGVGIFVFSILAWRSSLLLWTEFVTKDYILGLYAIPCWPPRAAYVLGVTAINIKLISDFILDLVKLRKGEGRIEP